MTDVVERNANLSRVLVSTKDRRRRVSRIQTDDEKILLALAIGLKTAPDLTQEFQEWLTVEHETKPGPHDRIGVVDEMTGDLFAAKMLHDESLSERGLSWG